MSPDPVRTRTGSGLVPGVGGRRVWGRIVRTLERFWGSVAVGVRKGGGKRQGFSSLVSLVPVRGRFIYRGGGAPGSGAHRSDT